MKLRMYSEDALGVVSPPIWPSCNARRRPSYPYSRLVIVIEAGSMFPDIWRCSPLLGIQGGHPPRKGA
jgi:hypothetical protein